MVKKKSFAIILLCGFIFFILLEIIFFLIIDFTDKKVSNRNSVLFKFSKSRREESRIDSLIMKRALFDPDLGFVGQSGIIRGRTALPVGKKRFASTYGTSYTFGYEVIYQHTWQYSAEKLTKTQILNLGLSDYCIDQSYLRFLKYYELYPSNVVFFGIISENLPRLLMVIEDLKYKLPKPRFIFDKGKISLYKIPFLKKAADLDLLKDKTKLREVMKYDDIFNYTLKYYGLDLIEGRKFPYTLELLKTGAAALRCWNENINSPMDYINKKCHIPDIVRYIIDEFLDKSKEYGFFPVFLINTNYNEYKKYTDGFQEYIDYMRSKNAAVIEIRNLFRQEINNNKVKLNDLYTDTKGHYSYLGNQIIAHKLKAFLNLLKNKKYHQAREKIDSLLKNSPDYDMINKNLSEARYLNQSINNEDKNLLNDPINTGFDLIPPERMAIINKARDFINTARGFLKNNKPGPAVNHYRKALELTPEWVELMNEFAWALATSENDYMIFRDEAINLSGLACEAVKNSKALYLDTFAAAYARAE